MSAEGVLTITALFQDNATAGLQGLNTQLTATASAAGQAEAGFSPLNSVLGTTSSEAGAAVGAIGPLGNAVRETGTAADATVPGFVGMGNALGSTGTSARGAVEPMGALNSSFQGVAKGGLDVTNTLQPMPGLMNTGGVAAGGFGTALKNNALAISAVAATAVGLVTGLTSIERAHVMAERSSTMLTAAQIREQTIQDQLTAAIQKYGPNSEQARVLTEKLALAHQQTAVAADRNSLAQQRYDDAIASFAANFAPQAILMAGGIVQIFGQIEGAGAKVVSAFTSVGSIIVSAFSNVGSAIAGFGSYIANAIRSLLGLQTAEDSAALSAKALSVAMALLPFAVVGGVMIAFIGTMTILADHATQVQEAFHQTGVVLSSLPGAMNNVTPAWDAMGSAVNFMSTNIKDLTQQTLSWIGQSKSVTDVTAAEFDAMAAQYQSGQRLNSAYWQQYFDNEAKGAATTKSTVAQQIAADSEFRHSQEQNKQALVDYSATVNQTAAQQTAALKDVQTAMKETATSLTGGLHAIIQELEGGVTGFEKFGSAGTTMRTAITGITTDLLAMKAGNESAGVAMTNIKADLLSMVPAAQRVGGAFKDDLNASIAAVTEYLKTQTPAALQAAIQSLGKLNDQAILTGKGADVVKQNFNTLSDAAIRSGAVFGDLSTATGGTAIVFTSFGQLVTDTINRLNNLNTAQTNIQSSGAKLATTMENQYSATQLSNMAINGSLDALAKLGPVQAAAVDDVKKYLAAKDLATTSEKNATKATSDYTTALNTELISLSDNISKEELTTAATMQFANAQGFAAKGIADAAKAYADALVKYQALTAELSNGTAKQNLYNAAVLEGKDKLLQFELTSQQTAVTDQEYANGLGQVVEKLGFFKSGLEATVKNEELFYKASVGDAQAMDELKKAALDLVSGFVQLADQVGTKLGQAMQKGQKEFGTAIKALEAETGIKFDPQEVFLLSLQGEMDNAKTSLQSDVGTLAALIIQGGQDKVGPAGAAMMQALNSQMAGVSPQLIGTFTKVITDIQTMANKGITFGGLQQLKTDMAAVGIPADKLDAVIASLGIKMQGAKGPTDALSQAAVNLGAQFKAAGDIVSADGKTVFDATGKMVGSIDPLTGAFHSAAGAATDFNTQIQNFGNLATVAQVTFQNIAKQAATLVTQLDTSFKAAVAAVAPSFGAIATVAQTTWNNMTTQLRTLISTVNTDFGIIMRAINTDMTTAATDVNTQTGKMVSSVNTNFNTIERTINTDMTTAARDVNTQTGLMLSSVNTNFGAIQRNINTDMTGAARDVNTQGSAIISTFGRIGSAAASAASQVRNLAAAINALHDKTITITTVYRTVGSPGGGGGGGPLLVNAPTGAAGAAGETTAISTVQSVPSINSQPITILVQVDGKTLARVVKQNMFSMTGGVT